MKKLLDNDIIKDHNIIMSKETKRIMSEKRKDYWRRKKLSNEANRAN